MQANIDREYMNALAEAADDGAITEKDVKHLSSGNVNSVEGGADELAKKEGGMLLYKVMPTSSKKRLAELSEQKMHLRNRGTQTDIVLLEVRRKGEMELNNELPPQKGSPIRAPSSGFRIANVVPISGDDPKPTIRTTTIREDEV
ncbi:unnamed protein product [Strongylus vulgaris]|uniref:Uncharacterized protein n=1 Tax=Strongylus vulgaris TaxID=40348 RepID=A0A3P7JDY6_STRVU|nr:unnamed protein product [Strongylus vulgaris]